MRFFTFLALCALFICQDAQAGIVTLIDPGAGDNRIASISNLDVLGDFYDVTFHHGIAFTSLPGGVSMASGSTSSHALNAIATSVNAIGDVTGNRTTNVFIANFDTGATFVLSSRGVNHQPGTDNYTDWFDAITNSQLINRSGAIGGDQAWLTFTAVPEPSSVVMFGTVLGLFVRRRRV